MTLAALQSGKIRVPMMIAEGRAAGERQALVDAALSAGRELEAEAAHLAAGGRHREAVDRMEKASGQMNRALQAMGVPVST